jgi:hypothetical protein
MKYALAATVLLIPLSAQAQTRPHAKDRPASTTEGFRQVIGA